MGKIAGKTTWNGVLIASWKEPAGGGGVFWLTGGNPPLRKAGGVWDIGNVGMGRVAACVQSGGPL